MLLTASISLAEPFVLVAAGDVMLSRGVDNRIAEHGIHYPFEHVQELLSEADLSFLNLECVLSNVGKPMPRKEFTFRVLPEMALALQWAGVDVVSVANNHSMDFGPDALLDMNDLLAHHGIAFVGAGRNAVSARRAVIRRIAGQKVAFLAYTEDFYLTVEAGESSVGTAVARNEHLIEDVRAAREIADIVVVSFHWGWEYSDHPTKKDRARARLCIDNGATLIIGHHPHVVQGIERYRDGLICYSLGNFIFDQERPSTQRGLLLRVEFEGASIHQAELLPIAIHPSEFRPRIASETSAETTLEEVTRLSKALGTSLERTPRATLRIRYAGTPEEATPLNTVGTLERWNVERTLNTVKR